VCYPLQKLFNSLNHTDKLIELRWLYDVGIGMEIVSHGDIFLRYRSAKHHDGYVTQSRISFDGAKHFVAAHLGKIKIENNESGARAALVLGLRREFQLSRSGYNVVDAKPDARAI